MTQQETNEQVNGLEQTAGEAQPLTPEETAAVTGGMGHPDQKIKCSRCGKYYVMRTQRFECPHYPKREYLI